MRANQNALAPALRRARVAYKGEINFKYTHTR